ncbi:MULTISPECIES: hypothetical protein [Leptolyngbya]|uniref:hypothetical protein n=1 Tax=Leptolyngbya TaxID=47251 RepID=UPI0008FBD404|nr:MULTISPECIES: hypothetical protein [Leptolyngbya]MBD2371111.1 hypothetical protein [Leptolyngbya sp. FACHB-161]MBD2377579.1 hypothetical protein [Leptolyngbya sp. FACHB-238]MBD2402032.1 hypothetical protein [Leptolyngbya sp. FACHB-239]MBD2408551.1 hypothetical protein [Leptolyngbya sp. FACHB-402]
MQSSEVRVHPTAPNAIALIPAIAQCRSPFLQCSDCLSLDQPDTSPMIALVQQMDTQSATHVNVLSLRVRLATPRVLRLLQKHRAESFLHKQSEERLESFQIARPAKPYVDPVVQLTQAHQRAVVLDLGTRLRSLAGPAQRQKAALPVFPLRRGQIARGGVGQSAARFLSSTFAKFRQSTRST